MVSGGVRTFEPVEPRPGWMRVVVILVVLTFAAATGAYVVLSWRWPLVWDMQVIHYVCFLMDRGLAPYRQIGDMNMPGAYLSEHWALDLFGRSDLGWRLYDFTLSAVLTGAMVVIARRYDWLAGVLAGGMFLLRHASEGPNNAGQRDQVMAVLLVAGVALCFEAVRQQRAWLMVCFGLATALAGAVKPTVGLIGPTVLVLALWHLSRERVAWGRYLMWTLGGFAAMSAIVLWFLTSRGSLLAFWSLLTTVLPNYVGSSSPSQPGQPLFLKVLPPAYLAFSAVGLMLAVAAWRTAAGVKGTDKLRGLGWEQAALGVGVFFGAVSFVVQGKGFVQHRYTVEAFVLIWASIWIVRGLRGSMWMRATAIAALAGVLVLLVPVELRAIAERKPYDYFTAFLERDLKTIGPARLQHQVQCLDIVDGCLTALFHLRIEQQTGATGDLLLFERQQAPPVERAHQDYWQLLKRDPPAVFVLSNWHFGEDRDFNQVDLWPDFAHLLAQRYVLVDQREFHGSDKPTSKPGSNPTWPAYRIYIRRDSPLLDAAPALTAASDKLNDN